MRRGAWRFELADPAALCIGLLAVGLVGAALLLGSRGLRDYDLALLPYTIGLLFATFTVAARCSAWLRRPATRLYWTRGRQLALQPGERLRRGYVLARSAHRNLIAQRFIRNRGVGRWIAHLCIAGGSTLAAAVTVPLVLGIIHFETRPGDPRVYRLVALGGILAEFHVESVARHVLFNLLNLSAVMVVVGTLLAIHRRLRRPGAVAGQPMGDDLAVLLLLLATAVSGLLLTFSARFLGGYGYPAISLLHALVVTATLLYLPFGKLFHAFQRPLHVAVALYREAGEAGPPAVCRSCGGAFAGRGHVEDLKLVLAQAGQDWTLPEPAGHYAEICPACRRRLLGFSQGRLVEAAAAAHGRAEA